MLVNGMYNWMEVWVFRWKEGREEKGKEEKKGKKGRGSERKEVKGRKYGWMDGWVGEWMLDRWMMDG